MNSAECCKTEQAPAGHENKDDIKVTVPRDFRLQVFSYQFLTTPTPFKYFV